MNELELELLLKYPLITCKKSGNKHVYDGHIFITGVGDVCLKISVKNVGMCLVETRFGPEVDAEVEKISTKNIITCLDGITGIMEAKRGISGGNTLKNNVQAMRKVITDYAEFTKFRISLDSCKLSSDLSNIQLSTLDDHGRKHVINIAVDLEEICDIYKPVSVELPKVYARELEKPCDCLSKIWEKYIDYIESLQFFFIAMEEIDTNCCVLDPEEPSKADCHRRVWLDVNVSVVVTVNPENVTSLPELTFLGPEHLIDCYRERIGDKLEFWDEDRSLLQSLLDVLGITSFPSKMDIDTPNELLINAGECSICFSTYFKGKMPEITCGNQSCGMIFHQYCLLEWLNSVDSERLFNIVTGKCPNCEKNIPCPVE